MKITMKNKFFNAKHKLSHLKTAAFLLFAMPFMLMAQVTVNVKDKPIRQVLKTIEKNTEFRFFYNDDFNALNKLISINVNNVGIDAALTQIFNGSGIKWEKKDNNLIVLVPGKQPETQQNSKVTKRISGVVQDDANGDVLPGVNIMVEGLSTGVISDINGNFSIDIPASNSVLVFSYVGYEMKKEQVGKSDKIKVLLSQDVKNLEEVVVVGYGVVKKKDLTGSVASIKSKDITALPTSNVLESMQGKITGLDMVSSSGALGSPLSFTVRGNRSLTASNAPLILVDGVEYGSNVTINPNDVESIEVLKDASSTAIYGSRGANGVFLITTKKGKEGKTRVDFNMYLGPSQVTNLPSPNNTAENVAFRREAMRAVGQWSSPADDNKIWDAVALERIANGVSTDWYKIIFDNALTQNYQVSVSGGTKSTKLSASLDYSDETGVLKGERLTRYNGRINAIQQVSKNFEFGSSVFFSHSDQDIVSSNVFNSAMTQDPYGVPYNEDGTINKYPFTGSGSTSVNIMMNQQKENYQNQTFTNRFFGTAYINATLAKGLTFKSNFGYDFNANRNGLFQGVNSTFAAGNKGLAFASKDETFSNSMTWENTLNYVKDFGVHSFNALLGQSLSSNSYENTYAEGKGLSFEESYYHNLDGLQQDFVIRSSLIESSMLSYFGRINYKLLDKYLLTATVRADGSSVLAEGNKWGYFPSLAFAWRVKEESFMESLDKISELKLRLSVGESGNSAVSAYQTTGRLSKTVYAWDEIAAYGYRPYELSNKDLRWEKTRVANLGLDFGILKNKVFATIDIYKTWTNDLLLPMILPGHTGFTTVISNVGKTETQGIELAINTVNFDTKKFKWTSDITFTANKEKITALNSSQNDVASGWFIGSPTQVIYDYEKTGIWQTSEATEAAKYGQLPGDIKVKDQDANGVIDAINDRKVLGQRTPKWTAGFNNRFEYAGFEFSFFVYARIGQLIKSEAAQNFNPSGWANSSVTNYWTPENPSNEYPRPNFNKDQNMLYYSTLGYRDGSFVKIKDITLGYNFPRSIISKLGVSQLRLYSTAKNYLTFSKFDDYDPERGGAAAYPMTKQLVFGLNVSF